MRYPLASSTWDHCETEAMIEVMANGRFTMGEQVKEFERKFADYFGSRYAVMVNSGSSANLLAVAAMRYRSVNPLMPGDEVIVPAVSWSTTYYPLHQYGLKLMFVDIDQDSLCLNLNSVRNAITPRTRAIFAVNLLGSTNDYDGLKELCREYNLILLEDNCESMGAKYGDKFAGTFGECGTFSMFFSHHISTMEGGMVLTDDPELCQIATSLRAHGWTRELPAANHILDKSGSPFDDMYRFVLPGYNVRPLELSAAIGLRQLDKLGNLISVRRRNAEEFLRLFDGLDFVSIQKPVGNSSWFGFALILQGRLEGERDRVLRMLTDAGVECRPIVAGNFTRNPVIRYFNYEICDKLINSDKIDRDGFFIGNHHFDIAEELRAARKLFDSIQV